MKNRGTIDFVIQKWINQRYYKWSEYTTSNHSLIAENGRIYSWGHHFPIAKWIDQNHILFNPEEYEMAEARSGKPMSTERHKRKILQALPADVKVIYGHPTSEMCAYRWFRFQFHTGTINGIDNRLERVSGIPIDTYYPDTNYRFLLSDGSQWRVSCDGRTRTRIQ